MARRKSGGAPQHDFRDKLLLNQWLIGLFGIEPLAEHSLRGTRVRPFQVLAEPIKDTKLEGLGQDGLHHFYHALVGADFLWNDFHVLRQEDILRYEENIVRHTRAINEKRHRPVVWKYFQWLSLLFAEVYLDRYFGDRGGLLAELNAYVERFNRQWPRHADVSPYSEDDLNKLCVQNATGSGKTLLMHVNLKQYRHYAEKHGRGKDLDRTILLTPNDRLSGQHLAEFAESGIEAVSFAEVHGGLFGEGKRLDRVDVLEITKLADQSGPATFATRIFGDRNLLLVDEGHRGMSGTEEGAWLKRRASLCAKGFTFEYSATFEQAAQASGNVAFGDAYAKTVLFDYSYRWFYGDGFGKDYQILNLPKSFAEAEAAYLTACLLKFYQQLRIHDDKQREFAPFNLEKPLWVFVGSTVSSGKLGRDEELVATDVAQIIRFIAWFLGEPDLAQRRMRDILFGRGRDTGLLDGKGNDIFAGAFSYLAQALEGGGTEADLYRDILARLFQSPGGGRLILERVKGDSGEIALRAGVSETPFGLINVGEAKPLCDHIEALAAQDGFPVTVEDSDFTEAMFASVRESSSPVNLLIGSKKFVEGWDCWRVSTMGLMHVGRSEGAQIIQLFGRGVRLKGYEWSLKRSGHSHAPMRPSYIDELETLNVFGIEADFMQKFRDFLRDEGLPGNEQRRLITVPLNVTHDFGKKLKILRPKRKASDGREYDFKKDGPVPTVGEIPLYLTQNQVVSDWYPRIQAMQSRRGETASIRDRVSLRGKQVCLLDLDALYFELEMFKRDRSWHNLNITKDGIARLLDDSTWYTLFLPEARLTPKDFAGVRLLQEVALELLKSYCERYYEYRRREYIEPRLELRELTRDDENIPPEEFYQFVVDGDEEALIAGIERLKRELAEKKDELLHIGDLMACNFSRHLFQPLFHVRKNGKVTILPVALNESEYQFVCDLKSWCDRHNARLADEGTELFLLRNQSRGKGVGFIEAGGFHPDFILWLLADDRQHITFVDPHGMGHEGLGSERVRFHRQIKDIERRLADPEVVLNSFILSCTRYPDLHAKETRAELEAQHILFMSDDRDHYLDKLFRALRQSPEPTG